jgi:hypothetical protein
MGMDLIGVGFTRRNDRECSVEKIDALIDAIPDDKLRDEDFLSAIDPSEAVLNPDWEDAAVPDYVRDALKQGALEYGSALSGHRSSLDFGIPGTPLEFIFAGGDSWGDDPFEGWSELVLFLSLAEHDAALAEAAGFVCGGLPDAATVARYAGGG